MVLTNREAKRMSMFLLIIALGILVFLIIRPIISSIIFGLILAYIFLPVHRKLRGLVKYDWVAAALVSVIVVIIIAAPLWFLLPVMMEQVFAFFQLSQELDLGGVLVSTIPSVSDQLLGQIAVTADTALSKLTSSLLSSLVELLLDFPIIMLHLLLVVFVFFFALRDEVHLREFVSGLSPLHKAQEKSLVQQFKDMTQSIIYGQVIVGLLQGILAGIGFLIFGVPNALLLTTLAVMMSVIPVIGPSLVYLPVFAYLLLSGNPISAVLFLLYNALIVSSVDNILRPYIVSRKTKLSQVIVLIGMIGGLFVFGVLGLILGPLILAYFITFLRAYKEKRISSLFAEED